MTDFVTDAAQLQDCVGRLPGPRDLKVIDHLDTHALRWLAASPLLFAGVAGQRLALSAGSGAPGFARGDTPHLLSIPLQALDTAHVHVGAGFGSLFLVPGLGETLRINGRIAGDDGTRVFVAVEECYLHCAKALLRADWWHAEVQTGATPPETPEGLLASCRLLILATADAEGRVDVTRRGLAASPPRRLVVRRPAGQSPRRQPGQSTGAAATRAVGAAPRQRTLYVHRGARPPQHR
ncbi:hypothetical protein NG827_02280 [Xanthomonas sacchari]|uniref:hypothetical protein n=1 Tax=Xanthomonas sacchari TaxID=56458 RepID=UPI00225AAE23|nr:hypothetical protein [Xanthomonas sacchari]UYK85270.1 hypothetical protein NG827_02280 [Xanthomonas sacchari]